MTNLMRALQYVLANEGGYVWDMADPGGPTKYGITLGTLSQWRSVPCSANDVLNLTRDEAGRIYEFLYWKPLGLDRVTQLGVATAMFDCGILFGLGVSALFTQKALISCGFTDMKADGHIGPVTVAALNTVEPAAFLMTFALLFKARIADIITRRPQSEKFEHGWNVRIDKLFSLA